MQAARAAGRRFVDGECPLQEKISPAQPGKTPSEVGENRSKSTPAFLLFFTRLIITQYISADRCRECCWTSELNFPTKSKAASVPPHGLARSGCGGSRIKYKSRYKKNFHLQGNVLWQVLKSLPRISERRHAGFLLLLQQNCTGWNFYFFFPRNKLFRKFQIKSCSDTCPE